HLPGHDVRVMFHGGKEDLVTRADELLAVSLRHEVDGLGGAADEDNLACVCRPEELSDFLPPALVELSRSGSQRVRGPVDIRVIAGIELRSRVNHRLWLVCRGGIVEPNEL